MRFTDKELQFLYRELSAAFEFATGERYENFDRIIQKIAEEQVRRQRPKPQLKSKWYRFTKSC